jgi:hypothetical protein
MTTPDITIPTSLLEAVARWALPEGDRPHLSQIVLRNNEMVATDGRRLVYVPIETHGYVLGLRRCDALAAVAAQDAWVAADKRIETRRRSKRTIRIRRAQQTGGIEMRLGEGDRPMLLSTEELGAAPPYEQLLAASNWTRADAPPDGIVFNPSYLSAVHDVVSAIAESGHEPPPGTEGRVLFGGCVLVARWGGRTDPVLLEGPAGSRFVIMPMARLA